MTSAKQWTLSLIIVLTIQYAKAAHNVLSIGNVSQIVKVIFFEGLHWLVGSFAYGSELEVFSFMVTCCRCRCINGEVLINGACKSVEVGINESCADGERCMFGTQCSNGICLCPEKMIWKNDFCVQQETVLKNGDTLSKKN